MNAWNHEIAVPLTRRKLLLGAVAAALPLGALSCSSRKQGRTFQVGGLPVTCNLTLTAPVHRWHEILRASGR